MKILLRKHLPASILQKETTSHNQKQIFGDADSSTTMLTTEMDHKDNEEA